MKKFTSILFAGVAILALSGCGGGSSDSYPDNLTTLFLVNEFNEPVSNVPYICDSMANYDYTTLDGAFSFYLGETCEFDFYGLKGTDPIDGYIDDLIYIVDNLDEGQEGIPYECELFDVGYTNYTDYDGGFEYDFDDRCAFFL